jgi:hypothetical protein
VKPLSACLAAATAIAVLCAAHPTPPTSPIGATIVSGTPQSAHAYAAPGATNYITDFPKPLVARIVGTHLNTHRMRFTCISKRCSLDVPNEPEGGHRVNQSSYELDAKHGQAALQIALTTNEPGTYAVVAEPVGDGNRRITRSAPFVLIAR